MIAFESLAAVGVVPAIGFLFWLGVMISVPIVAGRGVRFRGPAISMGVVAQVVVVTVTLFGAWPVEKAIIAVVVVPLLGWVAEFIGSRTGVPFGRYHYTD
ncbi:MAG: carotenoid biosynthesis protein, partial [Alkalispirochaeta sp.]